MPGSTTTYGFPYPLGTDPISDGDDQIKALAERVETQLGANAKVTLSGSAIPSATLFLFPQSALGQSANAGGIFSTDGTFLRSSVAGLFMVRARVTFGAATGRCFFQFILTTGATEYRVEFPPNSDRATVSTMVALPAAGGVKLEGYVTAAGSFTITGELRMVRVSGSAA